MTRAGEARTRRRSVAALGRALALAATAAATATSPALGAAPHRLVLAHQEPAGSAVLTLILKPWVQRLTALSGGRLRIALGAAHRRQAGPAALLADLSDGTVDIAWLPATGGVFPLVELFELPFMAWSAEATSQAMTELLQIHGGALNDRFRVLAAVAEAPGWLHGRTRPMREPGDLRGLRLFAPTRATERMLRVLGARPIAAPPARGGSALADLDGSLVSFAAAEAAGLGPSAVFHSQLREPPGFFTKTFVLAMNGARYAALPATLRGMLEAEAGLVLAQRAGRILDTVERLAIKRARADGQVFQSLGRRATARWRAALGDVVAAGIGELDAKGLDGRALAAEARALTVKFHARRQAD
jgi:TRAP-type C4-dicarboxylate transport system substrate-binding protein